MPHPPRITVSCPQGRNATHIRGEKLFRSVCKSVVGSQRPPVWLASTTSTYPFGTSGLTYFSEPSGTTIFPRSASKIESRFEVYTGSTGPADEPDYRQVQEYGVDDEIPVVLNGEEVGRLTVRDLLP